MLELTEITRKNKYTVAYRFKATGDISSYFWRKHFIIEYEIPVTDIPDSILALPFVGAVFPAALVCRDNIHVPVIDRAFLDCFPNVVDGFRKQYSPLMDLACELSAEKTESAATPHSSPHQSAALFSGGVDSTSTYLAQRDDHPLLITIIGSDMEYGNKKKADLVRSYIDKFAELHHSTHSYVSTNMRRMISRIISEKIDKNFEFWTKFQYGPMQILLTAPLLWYYNIPVLYVPSNYWDRVPATSSSMPCTDDPYRWGNSRVVHHQYDMDRLQKCLFIDAEYRQLGFIYPVRTCFKQDLELNCSRCGKCIYSMLIFRLANADLEKYGYDYDEKLLTDYYRDDIIEQGYFFTISEMLQHTKPSTKHLSPGERRIHDKLISMPVPDEMEQTEFQPVEYGWSKKIKVKLKKAVNRMKN